MRGHADPAAGRGPGLSWPPAIATAERRAAVAAGVLLIATLATGGAASPVLILLAAALIILIRHAERRIMLAAPAVAAAVILFMAVVGGEIGLRATVATAALLLATAPGLAWRREARRSAARLARLDDILAESQRERGDAITDAAAELADIERALVAVADRIGARSVMLWQVDGYAGTARPRAGSGGRPLQKVRLAGDPVGWAWQQDMRLRLPHTPDWAEPGTIVIAEPLIRRSEDTGQLLTYAFDPVRVPASEETFDESAVYLRGLLGLYEAREMAAAGQRRLTTLAQGLRRIPGELELETLAADLCETARSLTDGTGAVIGLWESGEEGTDAQHGRGEVLAATGADGGPRMGDEFTLPASELALAVRADAMLVRAAQSWQLGATCVAHPGERWDARPRALAALPLRGATGTIGVLAVWTSRDRELESDALELLHALSPYAALHLEHARAFGRLRDHADRDALTQLRNRRAFDDVITGEKVRFERYGRPVGVLVLDLDHFKAINDTHGHEAGDEVLRRVGRAIGACIRDVDTAARLGGEEFVVLLPETGLAAALEVAGRIRAAIAAAPVEWRGRTIAVRASIGVSACPDVVAAPADLVGSADAALYQAKRAGRDRVMAAEPVRR